MSVLQKFVHHLRCTKRLLRPCPAAATSITRGVVGFHEDDKKSGYGKKTEWENTPYTDRIKLGYGELKNELKLFKEEAKEKVFCDAMWPDRDYIHNDYHIVWRFNTQEYLDKWIVTADKDHNEGYSDAQLELCPNHHGLFHGRLSKKIPKDGAQDQSGYVNMRSMTKRRSFKRAIPHDFTGFTHLVIRLRGDGRQYMIGIGMDHYYDINWNDQFNYILYTRGGPYWQIAKIPFSKFFRSSKGRVQDAQEPVMLERIAHVGITCSDQIEGPFQLEIDYIGVLVDKAHREKFAYEMYDNPRHLLS